MHCHCLLLFSFLFSLIALGTEAGLIAAIEKQVVRQNRDGKATTWFHPRACRVPGKRLEASHAFMTVQSIGSSDYFGPVHWSESSDMGKTWAKFRSIPSLSRVPEACRSAWTPLNLTRACLQAASSRSYTDCRERQGSTKLVLSSNGMDSSALVSVGVR